MLFINYTPADEKYISSPTAPPGLAAHPPAPSFRPQEPKTRDQKTMAFAFELLFWLGSEALLLIRSQGIFPLYLMKYTDFFQPRWDVFGFVVWVWLLFCFFTSFWPGILFAASDRSCVGAGYPGANRAPTSVCPSVPGVRAGVPWPGRFHSTSGPLNRESSESSLQVMVLNSVFTPSPPAPA